MATPVIVDLRAQDISVDLCLEQVRCGHEGVLITPEQRAILQDRLHMPLKERVVYPNDHLKGTLQGLEIHVTPQTP